MDENLAIDSAAGAVTLKYYSTVVDTDADADAAGYLDFDGYLKLLVAQMSNQDFNDPMSDSEFIQQMASYSMMETINKMNEQSQISYAASLVGKAVTVNDGSTIETGVVESVIIGDGKYQLLVNGSKYDSDKVTDIIDSSTYSTLSKIIGMTATAGDGSKGEITNIIIQDGEGYAIINNNSYAFSELSFNSTETDSSDDTGTSDTDSTEGVENLTNNTDADGTAIDNSNQQADAAANSGAVQSAEVSASGAAMFLAEDGYEYNTAAIDEYANAKLAEYYSSVEEDEDIEEYLLDEDEEEEELFSSALGNYTSPLERAEAARLSAVVDDNGYYSTKVEDVSSSFSGVNNHSDEEGVTVRASSAMSSSDDDETEIFADDDITEDNGVAEAIAYAESGKVTSYMTSSSNPNRSISDFAEDPGVTPGVTIGSNSSYAQWPPEFRAYQTDYPAEAALANEYGTKMFDIRFIHNTDITSVINTDTILGSTVSGKYFTDLGYSGQGKLGEVVTWADGTQRVEIISSSGSTWYTTSGNYTLDEICDFSTNFNIADKLTVFEKVIRAAAKEYTAEEQAILDNYSRAYAQHAYFNADTLLGSTS